MMLGTYVQSVTVSYNHQQSSVCATCSFMIGSVAMGCAVKMILQNKTASEFTLRVLRSSPMNRRSVDVLTTLMQAGINWRCLI